MIKILLLPTVPSGPVVDNAIQPLVSPHFPTTPATRSKINMGDSPTDYSYRLTVSGSSVPTRSAVAALGPPGPHCPVLFRLLLQERHLSNTVLGRVERIFWCGVRELLARIPSFRP
jgi:hypothetical protein